MEDYGDMFSGVSASFDKIFDGSRNIFDEFDIENCLLLFFEE